MALARLDIPGLVLYGGSIAPGRWHDRDVTIQDVFEAVGAHAAGTLSTPDLDSLERQACPGAGACGGQFTANTMATVCEFLGISPFGSASVPATDADKVGVARARRRAGDGRVEARRAAAADPHARRARERHRRRRRHRRLDQRRAAPARHRQRSAACRSTSTTSTASARGCRCSRISSRAAASSPPTCIAPAAFRSSRSGCSKADILHADAMTITGRTIGEHAREATETPDQNVVRPLANPIKPTGGLVILKGNLAPEGAVVKVAGYDTKGAHRPGARVRQRRSGVRGRAAPARSSRATSSSSATKARAAARACARCWA